LDRPLSMNHPFPQIFSPLLRCFSSLLRSSISTLRKRGASALQVLADTRFSVSIRVFFFFKTLSVPIERRTTPPLEWCLWSLRELFLQVLLTFLSFLSLFFFPFVTCSFFASDVVARPSHVWFPSLSDLISLPEHLPALSVLFFPLWFTPSLRC